MTIRNHIVNRCLILALALAFAWSFTDSQRIAAQEAEPEVTQEFGGVTIVPVPNVPEVISIADPTADTPMIVLQVQPDEPADPNATSDSVKIALIAGIAGVLVTALFVAGRLQGKKPDEVLWSAPPLITNWLLPAIFNLAMQEARKTADPADDEALVDLAKRAGYGVTVMEGGQIVLTPRASPPPPPPL